MLTELCIRNFAIIDAIELEFADGFTVFTGETGAGKSILVDAVDLLVGGRASAEGGRSRRVRGLLVVAETALAGASTDAYRIPAALIADISEERITWQWVAPASAGSAGPEEAPARPDPQ